MAKILFVDEEEFLMQSFIDELRDAGHQVIIATDGTTAIKHLQNRQHGFDLIILDIMLPRGNHEDSPILRQDIKTGEMGREVLRQIRQEMNDTTPVIVLTAAIDEDLRSKILDLGVSRYLTKPVSLATFMNAVNDALSTPK